eukprot:m.100979 g.100979  ORF g.100979 m.100979 type:complete len:277 (+) comp15151_c0_seq2:28-858(+)
MVTLLRVARHQVIRVHSARATSILSHHTPSKRSLSTSSVSHDATDTLSHLGLSFVNSVEAGIVSTQTLTGCPWWLTVLGLTVGVRAIATFPITLYQQHKVAQLELMNPRIKAWGNAIAHRVMATGKDKGLTDQDAQALINTQLQAKRKELIQQAGCQRWKLFLPAFIQLPVWVSISLALRRAEDPSSLLHATMAETGTSWLWLSDMTQPDLIVFPLFLGLSNILSLELGGVNRPPPSQTQQNLTQVFRYMGVIMIPIAANVPAVSWKMQSQMHACF